MAAKQFVTLVIVALGTGWFAPDLVTLPESLTPAEIKERDSRANAEIARIAQLHAKKNEAWVSGATVLRREGNGHFYADVSVEGRDYRFLVDTGASVVALTGEDARAMGFEWDDDEVQPVGRGASGDVLGVPVTIERLELGSSEARGVQAVIVPEGLDVSLLGQSVLRQFPDVAIRGDEMTLGS